MGDSAFIRYLKGDRSLKTTLEAFQSPSTKKSSSTSSSRTSTKRRSSRGRSSSSSRARAAAAAAARAKAEEEARVKKKAEEARKKAAEEARKKAEEEARAKKKLTEETKLKKEIIQEQKRGIVNRSKIEKFRRLESERLSISRKRLQIITRTPTKAPQVKQVMIQQARVINTNRSFLQRKAENLKNILKEFVGIKARELSKEQEAINQKVQQFNKIYQGMPISPENFEKAESASNNLKLRQERLTREVEKLKASPVSKIKKILFGESFIELNEQQKIDLQKDIEKREKEIVQLKSQGKGTFLKEKLLEGQKAILKKGGMDVQMGEVAVTPIGIASAISKTSKIRFSGTQVTKGDKILTDIVFIQNGKRVGQATGVTLQRGEKAITVVAGKSGIPGKVFPTGKTTLRRVQSFISQETGVSKPTEFALRTKLDLLNKAKKVGKINVIKSNLDGMVNVGIGKVAVVKGQKFFRTTIRFPSGKISKKAVRGVSRDNFASISAVFTKGDLSKVIGRSFTSKGHKANFIGIIKGERGTQGLSSLSSGTRSQYQLALNKVLGATASSLVKAKKISGISKNLKLVTASAILASQKVPAQLIVPTKGTSVVSPRLVKQQVKPISQVKPVAKILTPKQVMNSITQIRQKVKVEQKAIQQLRSRLLVKATTKIQQKLRQRMIQQLRAKMIQVQRLLQAQKVLLRALQRARLIKATGVRVIFPIVPRIIKPFPFLFLKKKKTSLPSKAKKFKFTAQVKKGNTWISIGGAETQASAENKAATRVENTLRASLRVLKNGKVVFPKSRKGFVRSKSDRKVLVQKKTKTGGFGSRLGSPGELREIQRARRKKTRIGKLIKKKRAVKKKPIRRRKVVKRKAVKRRVVKRQRKR